ncbi:prepilin-type N-terminal cleavage/methylation domain-containing protein [Bacillus sp. FJAT-28004]|uniref:type IV pilus modification PilV family protein n=1 Tax=Bacillus sp. FJAT-28004 TaxID=1679165 RepID=UPI0006B6106E|nr:prepilin-type N-terminal cleavage/methylation domain-containing protein [Bacillus sp. FJAT-28004]
MRNQKGLTLIEVLGSIVLLGIAVLGITFILQQTTLDTKSNEKSDEAVVVARNVMEEIKNKLRTNVVQTSVYGQAISLENLRNLSSTTIYYPDAADRRYELQIQSYTASLGTVSLTDTAISDLDSIFRRVTVNCIEVSSSKKFELEAYVEYQ